MLQLGRDLDLARETGGAQSVGDPLVQNLDREVAVTLHVLAR
jgi:hypothetical protein